MVSALSPCSEPPLLTSMVEDGSGFAPEDFYSFFPNTFFSVESIIPPPYDAIVVPPMTSLALHSTRSNQGPPSRLPLMVGHRRSHSHILLGYSHQNPKVLPIASVKTEVTMTKGHQSGGMVAAVLKDMGIQAWSPSGSSRENEAKSSGAGSTTHHCHSLSVDSFMMGNLKFGAVGQQILPNVKFTEDDKKKVVVDKFLSEIVLTDPRRDPEQSIICCKVKGEKDEVYRGASVHKFQVLQLETATLCAQVALMQRNNNGLVSLNNELKTRPKAMDQQAQWGMYFKSKNFK
uniref:Uncharacterized protein n=1 Tax=Oryza meridionalis TaxID=40149 RepID=A0A0E0DAW6_9ORYZ